MVPLVARTVLLNVPSVAPAVKSPVPALIVPPPACTDQTGVIVTMLLPASRATATNCCVPSTAVVSGFGVTVMVATAPAMTVTVALPKMVPLVARTVFGKTPVVLPAVKRPVVALMVPPAATTDQVGVTGTMLLAASRPVATNCCVAPMTRVGFGVTTIDASAPAVMVTSALPERLPTVATTAPGNTPGTVPAVYRPVLALIVPPELTTDQTGVIATTFAFASKPVAVNCWTPLIGSVKSGATTIDTSVPGPVAVWTSQPVSNRPIAATPSSARAVKPRRADGRVDRESKLNCI